jgi:hypothetical protein
MPKLTLMPAGLAAADVGFLMALWSGLALFDREWLVLLDVLLLIGLGVFVWWKRTPLAAWLMIAWVAYEYVGSVYLGAGLSLIYPLVFVFALAVHARRESKGK